MRLPKNSAPYQPALFFPHSHYLTNAGIRRPWGRAPAYSFDFSTPEPIAITGQSVVQEGPFYRNSHTRAADVADGLSNSIFLGEHSSRLSDKTWYGTAPLAATCPKRGWPSDCNSAGCLVGAHSGPDTHDHPQVIIHPPNHPLIWPCCCLLRSVHMLQRGHLRHDEERVHRDQHRRREEQQRGHAGGGGAALRGRSSSGTELVWPGG